MKQHSILGICVLAAGILTVACSKNEGNETGPAELVFRASVESAPVRAAGTTSMGNGIKASILIYDKEANVVSSTPVASRIYTSDVSGNLTGTAVTVMSNTYDFYSVSENTAADPLPFTAGETSVSNGKDYLWVHKQQAVSSSAKQIDLIYTRSAAKVTVVLAGADMTIGNTSMSFTPADDAGAKMELSTGKIAPVSSKKAGKVSMNMGTGATANIGSYIMVPLVSGIGLEAEIKADVAVAGGTSYPKTYEASIPAPADGFQAGKEYKYTATLAGNAITFSGAQITDWVSGADGSIDAVEKP